MNKVGIIISLILAMAVGLSGCVTINRPTPAPELEPSAVETLTTTATIHMSEPPGGGSAVGTFPIYLDKGQQLYLSFRGIQYHVAISLIPPNSPGSEWPEGGILGYDSSTGWGGNVDDPGLGHLSLKNLSPVRSGRFIHEASQSGFYMVQSRVAVSGVTEADCEIQYEVR